MFYKKQKKILVDVLAWTDEIKEIKSCNVEIDRDLVINVISQSFASFLGCRITPEEPRLALVKNKPVRLLGQTNILIRLPKTKRRKVGFKKILCAIAENLMHHIVLARTTQLTLKIHRQHIPYYPP